MEACAPNVDFDFTCFSKRSLIKIAKACNRMNCKNQKIDIKADKETIYKQLQKVLGNKESNWLTLDFIKRLNDSQIDLLTFKPVPLKETDLFDTIKINEIMTQYNAKYPDFKFLGAQPSDISRLIDFDYKYYKRAYDTLGIVFNNDIHTKAGSHWVAVYIDNVLQTVEFFDSLGHPPNKYILDFLKHFPKYTFTYNQTAHQLPSSIQCGVYACYFIIQRLKGISFETEKKITEKEILKFRKTLFKY